jgi:hypothetical protein
MKGKFFLGWVAVFVVWMAGSFVVHEMLLHADYAGLPNLYRTEADMQTHFPLMILAHVVFAGAFVWVYARGVEPKPWLAQGIRYGLAVALLTAVPMYTIYYVVQPLPGAMVVKQIVYEGILIVILGVVAAFLNRQKPATA